ncbi:MAG TPA: hypothetical protein VN645_03695 [Steroidobacteraceae bacterium]|nr:hypothetical protein [Steroidobacteraceae bacterium]
MRAQPLLSPMMLFTLACVVLSLVGMHAHLERFITPEKGLGYLLGIIGGGAMLLLLIYPARKRAQWLAPIGSVKAWFQIHMVLGILGPLLVLFHANFQTGAANSNVALFCMLVVSGSGLIGRYFYSRIHTEFYGSQESLSDLRGQIARLQMVSTSLAFVPDLSERLAVAEAAMTARLDSVPGVLRLPLVAWRAWRARFRMGSHLRRTALAYARSRGISVQQMQREVKAARELGRRHIDAVRRVTELSIYERLFSLWHLLHLPLFFMLLVAGVVHIVAVHVY